MDKVTLYRLRAATCFAHASVGRNAEWWRSMAEKWLHMAEVSERIVAQWESVVRS